MPRRFLDVEQQWSTHGNDRLTVALQSRDYFGLIRIAMGIPRPCLMQSSLEDAFNSPYRSGDNLESLALLPYQSSWGDWNVAVSSIPTSLSPFCFTDPDVAQAVFSSPFRFFNGTKIEGLDSSNYTNSSESACFWVLLAALAQATVRLKPSDTFFGDIIFGLFSSFVGQYRSYHATIQRCIKALMDGIVGCGSIRHFDCASDGVGSGE
jgi:hypothetical protein